MTRFNSCSLLNIPIIAGPREKLYLLLNRSNYMFIAVKSFMLSPALGCRLCMVAAKTVSKE